MRLFGALVLIFVLLLEEIGASFFKRIITAARSVEPEENRRGVVGTPRPPRSKPRIRNTASLEQQALDLHEYPHHIQKSSPEPDLTLRLGPTNTSDVTRRSKMNRYPSSQGALTIGRTQNDQIQYQEQGGQQDFSGQGYYDWLIQQHNEMNQMAPPTLQSGEMNIPTGSSRSNPEAKETRELIMREMAARKEKKKLKKEAALQAQNSYYSHGNSNPPYTWDPPGGSGYGNGYGYGTQY